MSLLNRVSVAAGVRNLGYHCYWHNIFTEIGIPLGESLSISLKDKDKFKTMDYVSKSSLAGKRKRKTQFNDNVRELTIKELEGK